MARKTSKKATENVEQPVMGCDQACEVNKLTSDDEQLRLFQEEIKTLKKQNAGLRGELTRYKKIIEELRTDKEILRNELLNIEDEARHYREFCARPWYKRIFSK